MLQQSLMLIQITGSTFWLPFFLTVFGFSFIWNHASSLAITFFLYFLSPEFLKIKKVIKTTSRSTFLSSGACWWSTKPLWLSLCVWGRWGRWSSFPLSTFYLFNILWGLFSRPLLLVMCPCRMVLVKGLNPVGNSVETETYPDGALLSQTCYHL